MDLKVIPLTETNKEDFYLVHCDETGHGRCYCIAWWTPTWDAWNKRSSEENRQMREQLFDVGVYDGYLLYDGDNPVGWCQCGPRDQWHKLRLEYKLEPDPEAYAITCFVINPKYREIGLGNFMLQEILKDLKAKGVRYVQAFPRRGEDLAVDDLWTGPEKFFQNAEFTLIKDDPKYPIYQKNLKEHVPTGIDKA